MQISCGISARLMAIICISASIAYALDPRTPLTQYCLRNWQDKDGLPQNSVDAIVQTHDGYLWFATEEGLVRFDGVSCTVFDRGTQPPIPHNFVTSLLEDRQRTLWIGTRGGIALQKEGRTTMLTTANGLPADCITALVEDLHGSIWIATNEGSLTQYQNGALTIFSAKDGIPAPVTALFPDQSGSLWIGTSGGDVLTYRDGRFHRQRLPQRPSMSSVAALCDDGLGGIWIGTLRGLVHMTANSFRTYGPEDGLLGESVKSLCRDCEGSLWIGTNLGLSRFANGSFATFSPRDGLSNEIVTSLLEDRERNLWIGTDEGGVCQFTDAKFRTFTAHDGLANNLVVSILEDRHGRIWFGTNAGLSQYDGKQFSNYTQKNGLSSDSIMSLSEDPQGTLWIGTRIGVDRMREGKIAPYSLPGRPENFMAHSLLAASDGSLWIGIYGEGLAHVQGLNTTLYTTHNGLCNPYIIAAIEDHEGAIWIGTSGGGFNIFRHNRVEAYSMKDGLSSNVVGCFHEDARGGMWIGTVGGGLSYFKEGRFTNCSVREGLFNESVFVILDDGHGSYWMSCNRGIFRTAEADLADYVSGKKASITCSSYGKADGMKSAECNGGRQPAAIRSRTGKLWFSTIMGAVRVDPTDVTRAKSAAPSILIEQIQVDGDPVAKITNLELPPGRHRIEFRYVGLNYLAPEKIHFKYMLEGFDPSWVDAGTQRTAYYTNVPPGRYRFHVIACNHDGVWNHIGATTEVLQRSYFYKTLWFHALWITGLILLILISQRMRISHLRAHEMELRAHVDAALAKIRVLSGLLPICAWCGKVRDDKGYWSRLESYVQEHSEADFSHGICPECMTHTFPDIAAEIQREKTARKGSSTPL